MSRRPQEERRGLLEKSLDKGYVIKTEKRYQVGLSECSETRKPSTEGRGHGDLQVELVNWKPIEGPQCRSNKEKQVYKQVLVEAGG